MTKTWRWIRRAFYLPTLGWHRYWTDRFEVAYSSNVRVARRLEWLLKSGRTK